MLLSVYLKRRSFNMVYFYFCKMEADMNKERGTGLIYKIFWNRNVVIADDDDEDVENKNKLPHTRETSLQNEEVKDAEEHQPIDEQIIPLKAILGMKPYLLKSLKNGA
ncbi:unnamed protein product [Acanthoscelides obtectus]|uniref:Uncharacterized protein n=1 Tax=Acanthoscelides obtectus TaxID=200917 RepID=A0A9P0M2F7_ACAOB|nr:unnamed protein product [Acanthoscelides obtectus]CAK1669059.1 hypothetical protein AOBTE_LOCUS26768 [Acanthoscelides obtectus]